MTYSLRNNDVDHQAEQMVAKKRDKPLPDNKLANTASTRISELPNGFDPSRPVNNRKHEKFCEAVAKMAITGWTIKQCYQRCVSNAGKASSITGSASRLHNEPHIQARIAHLRGKLESKLHRVTDCSPALPESDSPNNLSTDLSRDYVLTRLASVINSGNDNAVVSAAKELLQQLGRDTQEIKRIQPEQAEQLKGFIKRNMQHMLRRSGEIRCLIVTATDTDDSTHATFDELRAYIGTRYCGSAQPDEFSTIGSDVQICETTTDTES